MKILIEGPHPEESDAIAREITRHLLTIGLRVQLGNVHPKIKETDKLSLHAIRRDGPIVIDRY